MSARLNVAAFTGGGKVPSARFRVRQYIPALRALGIDLEEMPSRFGKYPPVNRAIRPLWLAATVAEQAINLAGLATYDVILLQREIISKLVTLERWTYRPTLLDVDDAIFLFRDGYVAKRLAECANMVICGNAYLADWFSRWNAKVCIIPTAVDTERYRPANRNTTGGELIVGWIGTSSNLAELAAIEEPLKTVFERFPNAKLRVVCDCAPRLPALNPSQVEYIGWDEDTELQCIQGMDVGIMPLRDSPWARGKCSFKLLQYMACGLPSVASAVGMNIEVAGIRGSCRAVRTADEWVDALADLLASSSSRETMGRVAREVAVSSFGVSVLAPQLADVIWQVGGNRGAGEIKVAARSGSNAGSVRRPAC
jgi:glycosyltransferase involved in cell wall biosynthesis